MPQNPEDRSDGYLDAIRGRSLFEGEEDLAAKDGGPGTESKLGQIAIRKSLISAQQLSDALNEQQNTGRRLGEILVEMKLITPLQLDELIEEQEKLLGIKKDFQLHLLCKRCDQSFIFETGNREKIYRCPKCSGIMVFASAPITETTTDTAKIRDATHDLPEDVRKAILDKKNIVGNYVLLMKVGSGGGGDVYRAFDLVLERIVAIKVISGASDIDLERTRVEAQLCARLKHPGIPHIYEVGTEGNTHFMAMEYIDGENLHKLNLNLQDKIRVCRDVALILDYAHGHGIVHRDIKPTNVLVDKTGQVYLTDFGIAKIFIGEGASFRTGSQEIKGTPQFMSPEQAIAGQKHVDHRSDIYSLGSMIYYLATGRFPFEGVSFIDIVDRIRNDEPVPPGKYSADISRDLDTIVLKAMEKEKMRRYQTARELADDLDRYLKGEEISVKPPLFTKRMASQVKKRKAFFLTSAAVLAAGIAVYFFITSELEKRREAERATQSQMQITSTVLSVFMDDLSKAHGEALKRRMSGEKYEKLAEIARGTDEKYRKVLELGIRDVRVHNALGKLYRMIGDYGKALAQQKLAEEIDASFPPVQYELAILTFRQYRRRIDDLRHRWIQEESKRAFEETGGNPGAHEIREVSDDQLEDKASKDLKSGVLSHLERALAGFPGDSPEHQVSKGLKCYVQNRFDEAKEILGSVFEKMTRDNYGEIHEDSALLLSKILGRQGKNSESLRTLTHAIEIDTGNEAYFMERGGIYFVTGTFQLRSGNDPRAELGSAMEDYERAAALHAANQEVWIRKGQVHHNVGVYLVNSEKDYEKAVAAFTEAVRLGTSTPATGEAWMRRGSAYMNLGVMKMNRGEDPTSDFDSAVKDFDEAIRRSPTDYEAWSGRGEIRLNLGAFRAGCGLDPTGDYKGAISDFDSAIKLNSASFDSWMRRGAARVNLGVYEMGKKVDPSDSYRRAISDFDEAIRLMEAADSPIHSRIDARMWRGTAHVNWGNYLDEHNRNPALDYEQAIADYDACAKLSPNRFDIYLKRANARGAWMVAARGLNASGDSKTLYATLLEDFDHALKLNPDCAEAYFRRGYYNYIVNRYTEAVADFEKGAMLNPNLVPVFKPYWEYAKKKIDRDY